MLLVGYRQLERQHLQVPTQASRLVSGRRQQAGGSQNRAAEAGADTAPCALVFSRPSKANVFLTGARSSSTVGPSRDALGPT